MKRDELKKLLGDSATDEVIGKIMDMHGADIEAHKKSATDLQAQFDTVNQQLTDANKQIEDFKGMNIDEIKKAADDYKAQFEKAQTDHATQMQDLKFEHALDGALVTAKAKNPKAVKALLDMDVLKKAYDEKTDTIVNFDEHLKPVKTANDYLFESDKPLPKIITGTNNKTISTDAMTDAMRKGAGLPVGEKQE